MKHELSSTELGYLAGFFDGEGHISGDHNQRLVCSVTNTRIDVLKIYQELWGGGIYTYKAKYYSKTDCYEWKISSRQAEVFLRDIQTYLIIKKSQASLGIQLSSRPSLRPQGTGRAKSGLHPEKEEIRNKEHDLREWITNKIKELKTRGKTKCISV